MSRLILLDSGPLGMVTNPKAGGLPLECQLSKISEVIVP